MESLHRPFVCALCFGRGLLPASRLGWPTRRGAATVQKRRPSRMELSPRVAQTSTPQRKPGGQTVKRRTNSPFGGMNLTEAKLRDEPRGQISAAERKRQTRTSDGPRKERSPSEPFKALKMQRALKSVSYDKRSDVKRSIAEVESFSDFDLLPVVQESISTQALNGLTNVAPTPIQRLAMPALLGMSDGRRRRRRPEDTGDQSGMQQFLLAAETGSGKTLAYLLPTIDAIKRQEAQEEKRETVVEGRKADGRRGGHTFELDSPPLSNEPDPTTGRPRAIILLPTAELVDQVGALAKSLSHTIKFRSAVLSSAYSGKVIRNRLFSPSGVDLIISTPHLLSSIIESDPNVASRVSHLIVDEADSLFDRSFAPITGSVLDRATPSLKQLILCSATIPRNLDSFLRKRYPDIKRLTTPNLHAIPRRVQLAVVDVEPDPYKGNKDLACADTIWNIGKEAADTVEDRADPVKRMIVFVNEREKTSELAEYLRSKGIDASALSRDTDERKQAEMLASFTTAGPQQPTPDTKKDEPRESSMDLLRASSGSSKLAAARSPPKRTLANVKVIVMTDIGSRGIDTLAVKHVILYDVPHTSIDFIHRLGRVGRMGRRGRGYVLVGRGDRRDVVREVREGMFMGKALI